MIQGLTSSLNVFNMTTKVFYMYYYPSDNPIYGLPSFTIQIADNYLNTAHTQADSINQNSNILLLRQSSSNSDIVIVDTNHSWNYDEGDYLILLSGSAINSMNITSNTFIAF
jgi:hypothetical protein